MLIVTNESKKGGELVRLKLSLEEIVAVGLLWLMLIILVIEVVSRYVLGRPVVWTEEMARFMLVWLAFVGAAVGLKYEQHVRFTYLETMLPSSLRTIINAIGDLIVAVFFLMAIGLGTSLAIQAHSIPSVTVEFVRWSYVYAAVPVGMGLMLVRLVSKHFKASLAFKKADPNLTLKKGEQLRSVKT